MSKIISVKYFPQIFLLAIGLLWSSSKANAEFSLTVADYHEQGIKNSLNNIFEITVCRSLLELKEVSDFFKIFWRSWTT